MTTTSSPQLSAALQKGTLSLFIGADLPREITGLPSRADLAHDLARRHDLVRQDGILPYSLAEAAQRVARGGNRWEFTAFIRDALDTSGKSPQPFHRRTVELVQTHQIKTLITTAYDNLLELTFQEANVPINRVVRGSDVSFINPDRPTLIKLYGDAQQPDTLVVTDRDHSDLLRDRDREPLLDEVRRALRLNTVFFLGYNLADPDFRFLFDQVAESRFSRIAYAVWPDLPEADVQMWRDRGIVILDVDPLGILSESAPQLIPRDRPEATVTVPGSLQDTVRVQSWTYEAGDAAAGVAVSADGDRILAGTLGRRAICLDRNGQEVWATDVGNQAWRVALSSDGRMAVVGTGSTRPWDRKGRGLYAFDEDGQLQWHYDLGASVWGLALAADGRTVAVGTDGHETLIFDGHGHLLWRRETPGVGWSAWVWAASLSADGQTIAVGAADKTVTLLDRGGNLLGEHRADADVFVVAVSADGQTVAAGSSDQRVYLLDRQVNLLWSKKLEDKVWAVALPADGQRLTVGAGEKEGHVRTFDRGGHPLWKRYVEGSISSVDVSTGGDVIGVATRAGQIYLFDGDGEPIHHHAARENVRNVAVSADGQVAAAASEDGQVYGFLLRREPSMATYTLPPTKGDGETPDSEPPLGTGNRWAVIVGVDEYQDGTNYGKLQVCVEDVEAIREQLVAGGFDPPRIRLLTSNAGEPLTDHIAEPPTKANILVALKAIADATEPDDLLLFYYSGHGDEDGGESYLVAQDGRRLVLKDTAVPLSRVREIVEEAPARAKVIVLDACHSGADIGGKGPRPMSAEFIRRVFEEAEGLAVLASCKKGQLSYEWRESHRSVFTHFLLDALTGEADRDDKGFVTVHDASRHVTDGVKLWASQRNLSQTPTLQYTVAGDIILVTVQGAQKTNDD